jgi:transcriptional regulator with XRE-family HTH domain
MTKKTRYTEVSQMIEALPASKEFVEMFRQRLGQRQLIKQLTLLRMECGLSQADVAAKLGCSQSRISKLEAGEDGDIRIADLVEYAGTLELNTQFCFFKKGLTIADQIKDHFCEIKALWQHLTTLAHQNSSDASMSRGIAEFFNQTVLNFGKLLFDTAQQLPEAIHEDVPLIKLIKEQNGDSDDDCPSSRQGKDKLVLV